MADADGVGLAFPHCPFLHPRALHRALEQEVAALYFLPDEGDIHLVGAPRFECCLQLTEKGVTGMHYD